MPEAELGSIELLEEGVPIAPQNQFSLIKQQGLPFCSLLMLGC
jgi:hypothetical protein